MTSLFPTKKIPCRSLLLDAKGTRSKMQNLDALVMHMTRFYEVCEAFFCWKFRELADYQCTTFSDTCYVEVYNEPPSNMSLAAWAIELTQLLEKKDVVVRSFVTTGYTLRRNGSLLPPLAGRNGRPLVFHAAGVGTALLKAFEGEESHFTGKLFVEKALYDTPMRGKYESLGEFRSLRGSADFVRLL